MRPFGSGPLLLFAALLFVLCGRAGAQPAPDSVLTGPQARDYWVETMTTIADPVLTALSGDSLRETMPVRAPEGRRTDREGDPTNAEYKRNFSNLEVAGRTLAGMAPWLELGPADTPEGRKREKYIDLAVRGIENLVDSTADDFGNFNSVAREPVVHAAIFAHALLRAPTQLWGNLSDEAQQNTIRLLKSSRDITPWYSNWLLFPATIEAALLTFDGEADEMRMDYAVREHMDWYLGDGTYGDGPHFRWDYYNSYVIQPMLIDVLQALRTHEGGVQTSFNLGDVYRKVFDRARRYAEVQERMIGPDGRFPPMGRSIVYRFGAFQLLSQMALMQELPESLPPAQVRSALTAVLSQMRSAPDLFDDEGWLTIGFYGQQREMGERYISTASVYQFTVGLLALGLPPEAPFWSEPPQDWSSKKIWSGEPKEKR